MRAAITLITRRAGRLWQHSPQITRPQLGRSNWLEKSSSKIHRASQSKRMTPADALTITVDIQLLLLAIYAVGLIALWTTNLREICWHAIFASLCLAISPRFVRTNPQNPEILPPWLRFLDPSQVVLILLLLDLTIAWYVILRTGGSHRSPFSHFYFTLPILALLLNLPPILFYSYAGLALVAFTTTIASEKAVTYADDDNPWLPSYSWAQPQRDRIRFRLAFWLISAGSFYLALWVHTRRGG